MRGPQTSINATRRARGSRPEAYLNRTARTAIERNSVDAALSRAAVECWRNIRAIAAAG